MSASPSQLPLVPRRARTKLVLAYVLLLVGSIGAIWLILTFGERYSGTSRASLARSVQAEFSSPEALTPARAETEPPTAAKPHTLPKVLLAVIAIILASRVLGFVFEKLEQPRVIGEIVAGIVLGPSLLGRLAPTAADWLFPQEILPLLDILAQLGIILYMFLIGLELNAGLLRDHAQATLTVAHASITVPFALGSLLSIWLYELYAPIGVSFVSFALFQGVAMSITAFPVLTRILADRKLDQTELGFIAISCAAAGDVSAWCLLTIIVGIAQSQLTSSAFTLLLSLIYVALMLGVVRPLVVRWFNSVQATRLTSDVTALVLAAVLASACVTDLTGIHAIFGAFLLGAVIPHESHAASQFRHKLEDIVTLLLLPVFFAHAGLRTELGLLSKMEDWWYCGWIVLLATVGKFGGTYLAARFVGRSHRTSAALGVLMNTRGLMELVVLHMGLELGVISPALFAMMVMMALVTTIATSPLLKCFGVAPFHSGASPSAAG